ncbi:MAG: sulfite exporter TauE/SafE family protein [Acidobacteriaceae bacterium]
MREQEASGNRIARRMRRSRWIRFNFGMAAVVWVAWIAIGGRFAWDSLLTNWRVAVTMIFGSLVGGGTSEGGGAVAFPVFTKLLHIPAHQACLFAFAIQSVGMGAASLSILFLGIPIEKRVLLWGGAGGIAGLLVSTYGIEPFLPPVLVRIAFTIMVSSLGVALLLLNRKELEHRHLRMEVFGAKEKAMIVAAGMVGGLMSGLAGCGENIVIFMVMVLLFRVSEKVVTPTTVILMTIVTLTGFALHVLALGDFTRADASYWLAAVPIVSVGAPLGAIICSKMSRRAIVNVLLVLIAAELTSTVLIIPMSRKVAITAALSLAFFGTLNWVMSSVHTYAPRTGVPAMSEDEALVKNVL